MLLAMTRPIAPTLFLLGAGVLGWMHEQSAFVTGLPLDEAETRNHRAGLHVPGGHSSAADSGRNLAQRLNTILGKITVVAKPAAQGGGGTAEHIDSSRESKAEETSSRVHLLNAQRSFNTASNRWPREGKSQAEQIMEANLISSMTPSAQFGEFGKLAVSVELAQRDASCTVDYTKCPVNWAQKEALCIAKSAYAGPCLHEINLSGISMEEKRGLAKYCKLQFPCQDDCHMDFSQPCPSSWRETSDGVCTAPPEYDGDCNDEVEMGAMSTDEKFNFAARCKARWPCASPRTHDYSGTCPTGWILQVGHTCAAPSEYAGPCPTMSNIVNFSHIEKKVYEATCGVAWPDDTSPCRSNLTEHCPAGWAEIRVEDGVECRAPIMYEGCSKVQMFTGMSLAEKEDWANMCHAAFPCQELLQCVIDWAMPCPELWGVSDGGDSCAAPSNYKGRCPSVLHGLPTASAEQKMTIAGSCGVQWPCTGASSNDGWAAANVNT